MKTLYKIALCISVLCAMCVAYSRATDANGMLSPPPTTHVPHLFATAQSADAVTYAWVSGRTIFVSEFAQLSSVGSFGPYHVTALALAMEDVSTPVVAWRDNKGIHTAVGVSGIGPTPPHQITWTYADHGRGRTPQLLTNPLRLVYFDAHGAFTCQEWSGTQWQHGCEA